MAVAALAITVSTLPLSSRTIVASSDVITIPVGDLTKRDLALDLANDRSYYSRRDDPVGVELTPTIDAGYVSEAINILTAESVGKPEIWIEGGSGSGSESRSGSESGSGSGSGDDIPGPQEPNQIVIDPNVRELLHHKILYVSTNKSIQA